MKIEKEDLLELVGKTILWRQHSGWKDIYENVVEKVSPSGEYIKLGDKWYVTDTIVILEVLE